jgi:hypothetical protein
MNRQSWMSLLFIRAAPRRDMPELIEAADHRDVVRVSEGVTEVQRSGVAGEPAPMMTAFANDTSARSRYRAARQVDNSYRTP